MTSEFATLATETGPFTVLVADDAVLAGGWTSEVAELLPLVHPSLRPCEPELTEREELGGFTDAVRAYHAGDLDAPSVVPVRQLSGPFQQHAWDVLRAVPAGTHVSYTELAAKAGRPAAVRAAAATCANNAAALFVPCHRVLRSDGSLSGFRWGLDVKRWLLHHESQCQAPVIAG
jgi:methylated-DNA-[protein]-cysteine S-methyltransferase